MRIGNLSMLAALQALAFSAPTLNAPPVSKGPSRRTALRNWWAGTRTVSRHKRDPNSPILAAAIAKRERKAVKLGRDSARSWVGNSAHSTTPLDPFFIVR